MNRQIRRMCEHFGYEVRKLERTRIMNVRLGALQVGQWRNLTERELGEIMDAIAGSTGLAPEGHKSRRPKPSPNKARNGGPASRRSGVTQRKKGGPHG